MKYNTQAGVWAVIHCPATDSFLLGKRSALVNKPGLWNFFGGHIDPGETPRAALVRELAEETGLAVADGDLVQFGGASAADAPVLGYVEALRELHFFLLVTEREFQPRLNPEHSEYRWFKAGKLPRSVNRPTDIAISIGLIQKAQLMSA